MYIEGMAWSFRRQQRNRFLQYFSVFKKNQQTNKKNQRPKPKNRIFLKRSDLSYYTDHASKNNRPLLPSVKLDIVCLWYRYFRCDDVR